ncbi:MAG: acyl-CoA dehydrogenase family protein [Hyphomicrobiales bacterium]
MDLSFSAEEEAFRCEVQAFLSDKLRPELANKVKLGSPLAKAEMEEWHALLNDRGWLSHHWPVEYGGTGWSPVQAFIFELECSLAHAPGIVPFGVSMLAPVLIKYGNEAQKKHWLPRIVDGSDWWCQGYSEPGAGSDLASLKTSAVLEGDHYIVNGQKAWTTLGHHADMIFCLVRTNKDGKNQEGISFLLIDMKTPGIDVRPVITIEGGHEVNEVFFTDVKVPVENLVGEQDKGWTYAKYLLTYERTNIAGVGASIAGLARLKEAAKKRKLHGKPLLDDPYFAARVARVEIALENMKTTNLRVLAGVAAGAAPGAESSLLKIKGTVIYQELTNLMRRAMGSYAIPYFPQASDDGFNGGVGPEEALHAGEDYFNYRKLSIFGGSNEIQRNIVSKFMLGL